MELLLLEELKFIVATGGGSEGGLAVTGETEVGVGTSRRNEGDPNEKEEENLAETSGDVFDKGKSVVEVMVFLPTKKNGRLWGDPKDRSVLFGHQSS